MAANPNLRLFSEQLSLASAIFQRSRRARMSSSLAAAGRRAWKTAFRFFWQKFLAADRRSRASIPRQKLYNY